VIHQILVKEIFVILWSAFSIGKRVSLLGVLLVSVCLLTGTQANGQAATAPAASTAAAKKTIQAAQERLLALGYQPGSADGVMGARAIAALKKFQSDHGLPVTGQLDRKTLDVLNDTAVLAKKPAGAAALSSPQVETVAISEMKPRNCDTKDTKILVSTEEKGVTVNSPGAGSEYHFGQLVTLDGLIPTYWCTGAIWVFSGHVALPQATFDGTKDDPLRFEMKETGLTYVSGQGSVVLRDGTQKRLGQADGVTGAKATAATSTTPPANAQEAEVRDGFTVRVQGSRQLSHFADPMSGGSWGSNGVEPMERRPQSGKIFLAVQLAVQNSGSTVPMTREQVTLRPPLPSRGKRDGL
jgi:hypothetical protein